MSVRVADEKRGTTGEWRRKNNVRRHEPTAELCAQKRVDAARHDCRLPVGEIVGVKVRRARAAVARRDAGYPSIELEASGGVNLQTVRGIAETGVDRISVGALTHSAVGLDIGLDWL